MTITLRLAKEIDSENIASLVNRAYRPGADTGGWTHESNLVAGERISSAQVLSMFQDRSVILLLCEASIIVACVHVQGGDEHAYIGMLATDPARQANGLGKQMLRHAEQYAHEQFGNTVFNMSVISSRPELLAFYERRGYALTGEVEAYPLTAGVGQPMVQGIHVLSLSKQLS